MSGSDYTQTPNYSLYKPVPNADNDVWGDHLNTNADTLDALIKTIENKAGVVSFNTRTGPVVLTSGDVTGAGGAPLASPVFTGTPSLPAGAIAVTAAPGDADTSIATTAFVTAAVAAGGGVLPSNANPLIDGTAAPGASALYTRGDHVHPTDTSRYAVTNPSGYQTAAQVTTALLPYAPLASPVFTGDPQAPTPASTDSDTSIATTAFVQAVAAPFGNNTGRNLIHNGQFNVAQRGAGPWTTTGYTLDRWMLQTNLDTPTLQPTSVSDGNRAQIGDEAAAQMMLCQLTGNAGAASYTMLVQPIEGVRRLAGKIVTLSVWATCSAAGMKLGVSIDQQFGSGGSPSAAVTNNGQSVTLSTTFTRYSLTFTMPSISGKTLGTNGNDYTNVNLWLSSGTTQASRAGNIGVQSGTVNLWGVQLEIGSTATPLAKRDPADELALCQRFYQVVLVDWAGTVVAGAGYRIGNTLMVPMRAVPTATTNAAYWSNFGSIAYAPTGVNLAVSGTAGAAGFGALSALVNLSADL